MAYLTQNRLSLLYAPSVENATTFSTEIAARKCGGTKTHVFPSRLRCVKIGGLSITE